PSGRSPCSGTNSATRTPASPHSSTQSPARLRLRRSSNSAIDVARARDRPEGVDPTVGVSRLAASSHEAHTLESGECWHPAASGLATTLPLLAAEQRKRSMQTLLRAVLRSNQ